MDVTVKEYDASGARLRSTYSSGELAPGFTTANVASAVHARTGCHTIAIRSTGWSLLGFIMWRYRVSTYSCWNKSTRRVTHPADHRKFTRIDSVHVVDHRLIPGEYVHHFYNPDNGYDPFPLPGLNSHSAYYHRSKGEVHGPCLALHTCYERPWGSIRSLYSGNWLAKSGGNGFADRHEVRMTVKALLVAIPVVFLHLPDPRLLRHGGLGVVELGIMAAMAVAWVVALVVHLRRRSPRSAPRRRWQRCEVRRAAPGGSSGSAHRRTGPESATAQCLEDGASVPALDRTAVLLAQPGAEASRPASSSTPSSLRTGSLLTSDWMLPQ